MSKEVSEVEILSERYGKNMEGWEFSFHGTK